MESKVEETIVPVGKLHTTTEYQEIVDVCRQVGQCSITGTSEEKCSKRELGKDLLQEMTSDTSKVYDDNNDASAEIPNNSTEKHFTRISDDLVEKEDSDRDVNVEHYSITEKVLQAGIDAVKTENKTKTPITGEKIPNTFCSVCGKPTNHRCSRCKKAYYCGTKCQSQDFPTHGPNCKEGRILDMDDICKGLAKFFVYLPNVADAFKPLGVVKFYSKETGKEQKLFYFSDTQREYQSSFNLDDPRFENPTEYSFYNDWKVIEEDNRRLIESLVNLSRNDVINYCKHPDNGNINTSNQVVPQDLVDDPLQKELLVVPNEKHLPKKASRIPVSYKDFVSMRLSHNCMLTSYIAINVLSTLIINHEVFYHGLKLDGIHSCVCDIIADVVPMTMVFAPGIPDEINESDLENAIIRAPARTEGHFTVGLQMSKIHCYILDFSIPQFGIFPLSEYQTLEIGELPYMMYYLNSPQYKHTYKSTKIQSPDEFTKMLEEQLGNSDVKLLKVHFEEIQQAKRVAFEWTPNFLGKLTGKKYTTQKITNE